MLSETGRSAFAGGGTRKYYPGWRGAAVAMAIALVSAVWISPAAAENLEVPIETVVRADPGSEVVVKS